MELFVLTRRRMKADSSVGNIFDEDLMKANDF